MDRRTALRTLATVTALPMLAPDDAFGLMSARRALATSTGQPFIPATLTANEIEIVGVVADIILPRTSTPSATDVGVPAFLDLLATEWMEDDEVAELRAGLADLDADAQARFGRGFAASGSAEQTTLVQELDDQLPEPGSDAEVPEGFYPMLKRRVLTGYFTTEAGAAALGRRLMPGDYAGCVVPEAGR